jgi:Fe-S cluster assembly protein SufD
MAIQVSNSEVAAKSTPQEQRQAYLNALLETVQAAVPATLPLADLREPAAAIAQEHGFPDSRQEDWRFTNLNAMLSIPFQASATLPDVDANALTGVIAPESSLRLVFVNGQFSAALSSLDVLPAGLVAGSLVALQGDLQEKLGARLGKSAGHDVFAALNTTGFQDAAVVWVSRNCAVEAPIQIVSWSVSLDGATVSQPRCLVVAEAGSALTLVEDFSGAAEAHFTNSVTEIWVDDNAEVNHVRLQRESSSTFHMGKTAVTQGRDSRYTCMPITLGAQLSRHNLEITQTGPQTETTLQGLSAISGHQLADTHSIIAFNHPHGTVNQRINASSMTAPMPCFNGKMWVPRAAQQTDASQLNRNLLLSNKGRVDTKPELDIVADNVKCAHGATVSQLDANEVFYLQSRGISAEQAQQLLIYGFAMEIIDAIPIASIRETLTQVINAWTR